MAATSKLRAAEKGRYVLQPMTVLPKMVVGRPLLLGKDLDTSVQNYINALRKVGGVVNTAIVMAAAKLDIKYTYQQVELEEELKKFTTLNTTKSLFQFQCLPFGVSAMLVIIQRTMESLLQRTVVYIDDIVVASVDKADHLSNLDMPHLSGAWFDLETIEMYLWCEFCRVLGPCDRR